MNPEWITIVMSVLQNAVLFVLLLISVRSLPFRRSMAPIFFTFALVSFLMSGLYWLVYDMLRGETRMPFAANEFGEIAMYLLFASTLGVVFRGRFPSARREQICAAVFAAVSTALWIAWSGEWVDDIMAGLSFGYLLCVCARALRQSGALSGPEWILLGALSGLLLLLQGATFVLPPAWSAAADAAAYVVMFFTLIWMFGKTIRAVVRKQDPERLLALTFSCLGLSLSTMYMSAEPMYYAALLAAVLSLPLMLLALRREEAAL